jgi:hypothetical protein
MWAESALGTEYDFCNFDSDITTAAGDMLQVYSNGNAVASMIGITSGAASIACSENHGQCAWLDRLALSGSSTGMAVSRLKFDGLRAPIWVRGSAQSLDIIQCTFKNCAGSSWDAAAMDLSGPDLKALVDQSVFSANGDGSCFGSIKANAVARIKIHNTVFEANGATNPHRCCGGAAITARATILVVDGSTFVANVAGANGGAIWLQESFDVDGQLRITSTTFSGNKGTPEGSVIVEHYFGNGDTAIWYDIPPAERTSQVYTNTEANALACASWYVGACTDGTSADRASCEDSTGNTWTAEQPAACSDGASTTQGACEAAATGEAWSTVVAATCTAADMTAIQAVDQAACKKTGETWSPAELESCGACCNSCGICVGCSSDSQALLRWLITDDRSFAFCPDTDVFFAEGTITVSAGKALYVKGGNHAVTGIDMIELIDATSSLSFQGVPSWSSGTCRGSSDATTTKAVGPYKLVVNDGMKFGTASIAAEEYNCLTGDVAIAVGGPPPPGRPTGTGTGTSPTIGLTLECHGVTGCDELYLDCARVEAPCNMLDRIDVTAQNPGQVYLHNLRFFNMMATVRAPTALNRKGGELICRPVRLISDHCNSTERQDVMVVSVGAPMVVRSPLEAIRKSVACAMASSKSTHVSSRPTIR